MDGDLNPTASARLRRLRHSLNPALRPPALPVGERTGDEVAELALPSEAIAAAEDELIRDLLLPRLLPRQVKLAVVEQFHPNTAFHHRVKHRKELK